MSNKVVFWKTSVVFKRAFSSFFEVIVSPSILTSPPEVFSRNARILRIVVFPEPLGPRIATISHVSM